MDGLFVARLQLVLVAALQQITGKILVHDHRFVERMHSLSHVQLQADLIVQFQLHNQERIPGLTLSQRRVKTQNDKSVGVVILRKQEELLDGGILDFIVVGLTP